MDDDLAPARLEAAAQDTSAAAVDNMGLLDQGQIESFERDGYLILRGFFDDAEVAELRDATVQVLLRAERGTRGVGFDPWTKEPGDALNPNRVYYYNDLFPRAPQARCAHAQPASGVRVLRALRLGGCYDH